MSEQKESEQKLTPVLMESRARFAWKVIGLILLSSVGLAMYSSAKLKNSSRVIQKSLREFGELGKRKSAVGCVESAMDWGRKCQALSVLCEGAVPKMVGACLGSSSRLAYCKKTKLMKLRARFTYAQCKGSRWASRKDKKSCAKSYGALWSYCKHVLKMEKRRGKKGASAS